MLRNFFFLVLACANRTASFPLYAFGRSIPGLVVFFADDLAYIGYSDNSLSSSTATNVTFTLADATLTATPNTTTNPDVTWSSQKLLYIVPNSSSATQAGFVDSNSSISNATTDGWRYYGRQLANSATSSDGSLLSAFWAVETNTTGLWTLNWNNEGVNVTNGTPVAIKNAPPRIFPQPSPIPA